MKQQVDVAIIGAGLTGLTLAFYLKKAGKKVIILEQKKRTGGVMHTIEKEGFIFETGPNSGSMGTPEMAELFEDLGDAVQLEVANEQAKERWIWKDGKWHNLPSGLWSGLKTPLFRFSDKIRILGEPFRPKGNKVNESVAELVERRLGKSYLDYAVNPFISGIYAGDPKQLVTQYALPKLYQLEQNYGSFIRGAMKKAKTRTERDKKATRVVFSAKGGKQKIIDALSQAVGYENILLGIDQLSISHKAPFSIQLQNQAIEAKKVVSTTGAKALPQLFPFVDKQLMNKVHQLRYAKVVQAVVGFHQWKGKALTAFGGLIPEKEKKDVLGILFPSAIFSNRAPQGGALMTFFMGGIKRPDIIAMSDEEIKAIVQRELKATLQCDEVPDLLEIKRYQEAIAQYDATSLERLTAIQKIETQYPGLILAGNIRDGIGMSDRVKQARKIAEQLSSTN